MKISQIVLGIIVIGFLFFIGSRVAHSTHHGATQVKGPKTSSLNSASQTAAAQTTSNPLSLYPKASLSCSTEVSLVQATVDYVVTGMGCSAPSISGNATFLRCNGTIMQHAVDVTLECRRSRHYAAIDQLECLGTTNSATNPTNLTLNYTCALPTLSGNKNLYTCSGAISGYKSLAINLPMTTTCSGV